MAMGAASRRGGRRGRRSAFSEINITPLTDVVLVLLVIFMVTAQYIQTTDTGMNVNLPGATQVESLESLGGVRISVDREGNLAVDGTPTPREELQAQLVAVRESPQQLIVIEGDRETVLQNVVDIMDSAMGAGMPNIVLATAAEEPAGAFDVAPATDTTQGQAAPPPAAGGPAPDYPASPFVTPPPPDND